MGCTRTLKLPNGAYAGPILGAFGLGRGSLEDEAGAIERDDVRATSGILPQFPTRHQEDAAVQGSLSVQ